ncbi:MAG TPA: NAD-dependent malic enzyme [Candidatus Dormibacteraeota bacterium]|nr:NAD-dependent malic enzyme [Candidatus Dormibacteraeota bacterium]
MLPPTTSSYAFTARCRLQNRPGMLGRLTSRIGEAGGDLRAIDIARIDAGSIVRDLTVHARDSEHAHDVVKAIRLVEGVEVLEFSDRTFQMHAGGKISVIAKNPIKTRDDLSMAYTPGVARVCRAIYEDRSRARSLTIKKNCIAVVTDGSAVLGLGNLGPEAALPVMEGKAMLFKEFGDVDAFPICLATQDIDEIVETVVRIAPTFGGINLEDIAAPRCFAVEERLIESLDIPVFHDDQHGTAVVVMAALINAMRIVDKKFEELRVVVSGTGAAGVACTKMMLAAGVTDIIGVDRHGSIYKGREPLDTGTKRWYAGHTNPRGIRGNLSAVIEGADVFLGVSAPDVLTVNDVARMGREPVVFALANPDPEIRPELVEGVVAVMATGRSDYPNQINNVLAFPGIFRGLLDCGAKLITDEMKLVAAHAIAEIVGPDELGPEYVVPSVFNRAVAPAVAAAIVKEAEMSGLALPAIEPEDPLYS